MDVRSYTYSESIHSNFSEEDRAFCLIELIREKRQELGLPLRIDRTYGTANEVLKENLTSLVLSTECWAKRSINFKNLFSIKIMPYLSQLEELDSTDYILKPPSSKLIEFLERITTLKGILKLFSGIVLHFNVQNISFALEIGEKLAATDSELFLPNLKGIASKFNINFNFENSLVNYEGNNDIHTGVLFLVLSSTFLIALSEQNLSSL